jgi:P-type Cu+ transporter
MALEPLVVPSATHNPELASMTLRLWLGVALTLPLLAVMISDVLAGHPLQHRFSGQFLGRSELAFASPVVLWAGLAVLRARLVFDPQSQP